MPGLSAPCDIFGYFMIRVSAQGGGNSGAPGPVVAVISWLRSGYCVVRRPDHRNQG
jgi:hypothetical protein